MSFDINEAVFDVQGTYLEEPVLRYEHALMAQFAASPEGQAMPCRLLCKDQWEQGRKDVWEVFAGEMSS